jgi:hypothetical protein
MIVYQTVITTIKLKHKIEIEADAVYFKVYFKVYFNIQYLLLRAIQNCFVDGKQVCGCIHRRLQIVFSEAPYLSIDNVQMTIVQYMPSKFMPSKYKYMPSKFKKK